MTFFVSWCLFGFIWWVIGFTHRDFEKANIDNSNHTPCVNGVTSFTSAFLFSLETQHTIGYGSRHINTECSEAIIVLMIQSIVGVLFQALVTGR